MIASATHRLLFVHVQKTGGLTIEALLTDALADAEAIRDLPDGRHARLADALAARPALASYWTFGFVRNPWARMHSWHAMILRRKAAAEGGNKVMARRMRNMDFWRRVGEDYTDFEAFVLRGPDEFPRLRTAQLDYLRTPDREADFIGRTERLGQDVAEVFARFGLPEPAIEHRNAGPPTDYRVHYTDAMRDRVAEIFAPDIERFGYEF
ncbi:MAG TPA: sulfotransferase family 2 domain-containing protein [Nocardioides sp.]|nr:sulfotransferase family 2 domain-containing protein [Nocardioides sp.]